MGKTSPDSEGLDAGARDDLAAVVLQLRDTGTQASVIKLIEDIGQDTNSKGELLEAIATACRSQEKAKLVWKSRTRKVIIASIVAIIVAGASLFTLNFVAKEGAKESHVDSQSNLRGTDGQIVPTRSSERKMSESSPALAVVVKSGGLGDNDGGSITLEVTRGTTVCCSPWDWIGIYSGNNRLSYRHSGGSENPTFEATFDVPAGQSYTFKYSTSVDGWEVHDIVLTAPPVQMQMLIPSYWWPTNTKWDDLISAVALSGFDPQHLRVILNSNNGYNLQVPDAHWELWLACATKLTDAGIKVFAYVNLCSDVVNFACSSSENQGNRPFGDVKPEIDKYLEKLGPQLTGFFFDDASQTGSMTQPILEVTHYVNGLSAKETIMNPGALSQDQTLFAASDVTVQREGVGPGVGSPFQSFPNTPASKSSMLLHQVGADMWNNYLSQARDFGYGHFYATSGGWDSLPSYLQEMLEAMN